ncbi:hypothetical protein CO704_15675 [Cedecea neteri]|uniref:Uncharacterized protein n=1 Tax=Cedecea neteri TaxID=158822 RepID=A0A291E0F7_9ENTR|nr:hypothetical protein CO704_15675 [Cedecea neteri]
MFFFLECFRKCLGDCQSKTSIFSGTCQIFLLADDYSSFSPRDYRAITMIIYAYDGDIHWAYRQHQ